MFGDNPPLFPIPRLLLQNSGVAMIDKFITNFKIALPAAIGSFCYLSNYLFRTPMNVDLHYDFNVWQVIPYIVVLIASLCRFNVFGVLCAGVVLFSCGGTSNGFL